MRRVLIVTDAWHPQVNGVVRTLATLAEVAPHIELYGGAPGVPYAFEETRFVAAHGAQDTALGLPPTGAS